MYLFRCMYLDVHIWFRLFVLFYYQFSSKMYILILLHLACHSFSTDDTVGWAVSPGPTDVMDG